MQQAICEIVPVQKIIGIKTVNKAIGTIKICLLLNIKLKYEILTTYFLMIKL